MCNTVNEIGVFKFKNISSISNYPNSFIYINAQDFKLKHACHDSDIISVRMLFGSSFDKEFFTSFGPFLSQIPCGFVAFSLPLAKKLGIKENDEILLSQCPATSVSSVSVRPKTNEDYNIMATMHYELENTLMDQVRIVARGQIIFLKIGNIRIELLTDSFLPDGECGRLEKYTEFVVLDVNSKILNGDCKNQSSIFSQSNVLKTFWNFLNWGKVVQYSEQKPQSCSKNRNSVNILKEACKQSETSLFRVIPDDSSSSDVIVTNCGFKTDRPSPCCIMNIAEKTANVGTSINSKKCLLYSLVQSNPEKDKSLPKIYLNKEMRKSLNVELGCRVKINEIDELPEGELLKLDASKKEVGPKKEVHKQKLRNFISNPEKCETPYFYTSLKDLEKSITNNVPEGMELKNKSNILLIASPGCGKTFLLENLKRKYTDNQIFCNFLSCKAIRGKKIESLLKIFIEKWSESAYREPSILILDDIDALLYQDEEETEGEIGVSAIYSERVASMLTELAESFQNESQISVIATASNLKNVTNALSTTRGPRLFDLVLDIPEMTADERGDLLRILGLDINDDIIARTQGYQIQDLLDLSAKARLNAAISETNHICLSDVEKALQDMTPMALLGIRLHKEIPYTWEDIGGMTEIKIVLDEIFRWPSQYPQVFNSCPLRLQSGALLYGPPGCGKTLIAGALANECGMNFISVKGPEVLSKYVGASEAAVRNLFDRASRAQPCLLFFDELDSLAPRRGHDTTGVTDRVVNQLLTQLDGVEARTGIWILAASSRPDLVDPALLRPGRLDRAVYCPIPSKNDRLEILKVLIRNLTLSPKIDLLDVAAKTETFTGADLQALLYNSHMKAVQNRDSSDNDETIISLRNVEAALAETRPSLSPVELSKFEKLYRRFTNSKRKELEDPVPQRVTLM